MAFLDNMYFDLYVKSNNRDDIPSPAEYFSNMIYPEEKLSKYRNVEDETNM